MTVEVLVINLESELQRRVHMQQHLNQHNLDFSFITAVDGRKLSPRCLTACYNESAAKKIWYRPLALTEIGCVLSHLKCYQYIAANNLAGALILEDDIILYPQARNCFARLGAHYKSTDNKVVFFQYHKNYARFSKSLQLLPTHKIYPIQPLWVNANCAHAYYITQQAARSLSNYYQKITHPIDCWNKLVHDGIIELDAIIPYVVEAPEYFNSAIKQGRDSADKMWLAPHKTVGNRIKKLMLNMNKKIIYQVTQQKKQRSP